MIDILSQLKDEIEDKKTIYLLAKCEGFNS